MEGTSSYQAYHDRSTYVRRSLSRLARYAKIGSGAEVVTPDMNVFMMFCLFREACAVTGEEFGRQRAVTCYVQTAGSRIEVSDQD